MAAYNNTASLLILFYPPLYQLFNYENAPFLLILYLPKTNQAYTYLIFYKIFKQTIYTIFPIYIYTLPFIISHVLYSLKTNLVGQ